MVYQSFLIQWSLLYLPNLQGAGGGLLDRPCRHLGRGVHRGAAGRGGQQLAGQEEDTATRGRARGEKGKIATATTT